MSMKSRNRAHTLKPRPPTRRIDSMVVEAHEDYLRFCRKAQAAERRNDPDLALKWRRAAIECVKAAALVHRNGADIGRSTTLRALRADLRTLFGALPTRRERLQHKISRS